MRAVGCGAALALAAACANIQPPPGGPPDTVPPALVSFAPDSLAVLPGFDGEVEFRFSEVIAEGTPGQAPGTGELERLVVFSPAVGSPEVRWRRNRITVKPRGGWEPNRVYRVELLPGVADLRNNRSQGAGAAGVVTFTTGAPIPAATLRGIVYDWTTARPAAGALIEAVLLPDSLPYRSVADSAGRFTLGPVPAGPYLVFGVIDQDRDRARDPREALDSVRIAGAADSVRLWTFVRDTVAARIREIAVRDTVTATITFTQMLDPALVMDRGAVTVLRLPDSTRVPVVSLTALAPGDTMPAVPPGMRAPLRDRLVLRVGSAWGTGTRFVIRIRGVRSASGVAGDVSGLLDTGQPRRAPAVPTQSPLPPAPK